MPVICPPSLTELCRYLFIKEIVRFPAGSGRLLFTAAEQQPEDGTGKRAAVQHLPAQGHGHVAAPGVHPGAEARLLEQQRCHQAHHRAHAEHPACDRPGRQQLQQRFSTRGVQGWAERAETPVCGPFLLYFAGCFQDFNKNLSISLYSLRMDKRCTRMYNKARNQRSTAEAQMRANPADLKQKGARPMVDMEPAQQGQAVGIH